MPQDTLNPDRTQTVFASPIDNLRLIRASELDHESPYGGSKIKDSPGLRYEFEDGYLVITDEIRDRDARFFEKYAAKHDDLVDDRPADEWLRDHRLFQVEKGFVEVERAIPPSSPVLLEITNALVADDLDAIVAIYEAEEQGDQRPDVMEAAVGALRKLEAQEESPDGG